jgi:hypothetical protein
MFNKKFEDQLRDWNAFRRSLEISPTPIEDTIDFYSKAPMVSHQVDPYDSSSWLTPWELLKDNKYCEFSKILAICYTLQLTDKFMDDDFEIHIIADREKSETNYLLFIRDLVISSNGMIIMNKCDLPNDVQPQTVYAMPKLY